MTNCKNCKHSVLDISSINRLCRHPKAAKPDGSLRPAFWMRDDSARGPCGPTGRLWQHANN